MIDDAIIEPEWFDACIDAHLNPKFNGSWQAAGMKLVAFDPADTGDAKGFAYRHGNIFIDVCDKDTGDADDGMKWALDKAHTLGADDFTFDYSGIGSGMAGAIKSSLAPKRVKVIAFNGGEGVENPDQSVISHDGKSKKNKDLYINKRAQYYWRLYELCYNTYRCIVKGQYVDPADMISFSSEIKSLTRLRAEICRIPRVPRGDGVIQIMSKKDMLKKGISSPNMADAVMMLMYKPHVSDGLFIEFD